MANGNFAVRGELRLKNGALIKLRESFKMGVSEFAEFIGISPPTYCGYETMRLYPGTKHAKKLAELAGMSPLELFPEQLQKFATERRPRVVVTEMEIPPERLLSMDRREVRMLPASIEDDIDSQLDTFKLKSAILNGLNALTPIEARILRWRFGLDGEDELSLTQIGEKYSLSPERIRQLQEQALGKLRRCNPVIGELMDLDQKFG